MNPELEQLKKALQPEAKMNIVDRCRITVDALSETGDYPKQQFKLAQYLGVSENLVIKMRLINDRTIGQLKDWLKTTPYRVDMAYKLSMLEPEDQLKFANLTPEDKNRFLREFGKTFINVKISPKAMVFTDNKEHPPIFVPSNTEPILPITEIKING